MKRSRLRQRASGACADGIGIAAIAAMDADSALRALGSGAAGLPAHEARARLASHGANTVAAPRRRGRASALLDAFARPLPLLLLALAALDLLTGQVIGAAVIAAIVLMSSLLGFQQSYRADRAAERLRAMVRSMVDVLRPTAAGAAGSPVACPAEQLVPGDVVLLSSGDPLPADVRFIEVNNLFVDQSALSGESLPVEKHGRPESTMGALTDLANIGLMGSHVNSGSARAVVVATGNGTGFGYLAAAMAVARERTEFDRGIERVIALLLRIMLVMAPTVLLLNWLSKGDWHQALLFATAVAVGLAPEMLPMIVTVNLARGAMTLARRGVIVKRLTAVQALGAIDVLCADKTGTLTQGQVVLERHVDAEGNTSERVLDYAYLNSYFQTGLRNLLDAAVLGYSDVHARVGADCGWRKTDEIPWDFARRRMSVVLERPGQERVLICKGAVEEILGVCGSVELQGARTDLGAAGGERLGAVARRLNAEGLRVIAIAYRTLAPQERAAAAEALECDLTLLGYIAFFDPPRDSAAAAVTALAAHGVEVKVLSGDNGAVCAHVCGLVGIDATQMLDGPAVARLDDAQLARAAIGCAVFSRLLPEQKTRVIRALQAGGRVVGFLGDGINDGPALRSADVGIAVDTGAEIARESADLIVLQKSLMAIDEGVIAGRAVFGNIVKYVRMSASSNFGNMFSVLGTSIFLPFLPMAPVQVLLNNLLYDCSQAALATDRVEPRYLTVPRRWEVDSLRRYVLCFGPISSVFDYATFALLWFGLSATHDPALFQSGWFVESLLSQTLIVYVLRTAAAPSLDNLPSPALMATTAMACGIALWLPGSPLAPALGMAPLPVAYWWGLAAILAAYALVTEAAKSWLVRRFGIG